MVIIAASSVALGAPGGDTCLPCQSPCAPAFEGCITRDVVRRALCTCHIVVFPFTRASTPVPTDPVLVDGFLLLSILSPHDLVANMY